MAAGAAVATDTVVVAFATRDRQRSVARATVARRQGRVVLVRSSADAKAALRAELVDAVLVDLSGPGSECMRVAELASDFPSAAFLGMAPYRVSEAPRIAEAVEAGCVDVLAEGVDEESVRPLVAMWGFSARFARALLTPPPALGLRGALPLAVWPHIVAGVGRPMRTASLASALGVSREHLSRAFTSSESPPLKRLIDLVRVFAAAELSKNPGHDVGDVAGILGFASASHLSTTTRRLVGTTASSLARLRPADLIARFAQG